MEPVEVRPCTVAELERVENLDALLTEYGVESAIDGLGAPCPQFETYRLMESAGLLFLLGAFQGDHLVGFIAAVVSVLPHFGVKAATVESFFVADVARKGGAGLRLLRAAEHVAKEAGAAGLFVSAPVHSRLESVMHGMDYEQTNAVFFRRFA